MSSLERTLGELKGAVEMNTAETTKLRTDVSKLSVKVHRLNATVRQLRCQDPDTCPDVPMGLDDPTEPGRLPLQSYNDDDDSVLRLALETVRAVREGKRSDPPRLSFMGIALQGRRALISVAAVLVTLLSAFLSGHLH
jgi:hypothetical protein